MFVGEGTVEVRGLEKDQGSAWDRYLLRVYHRRVEANLGQLHHQELDSEDSLKRKRRQGQAAQ